MTGAVLPRAGGRDLVQLAGPSTKFDHVVALAGNPNTGKSTVFNALTGLRQHTGNWPGKTVARAEGGYLDAGKRFRLVDLPGTYSLQAGSADEEVAAPQKLRNHKPARGGIHDDVSEDRDPACQWSSRPPPAGGGGD